MYFYEFSSSHGAEMKLSLKDTLSSGFSVWWLKDCGKMAELLNICLTCSLPSAGQHFSGLESGGPCG